MSQEFTASAHRQKRAQRDAMRQCKESWYRKDAVADEVWLMAHIGSTSAIARMRLKSATRRDREACGDGKWVKAENSVLWSAVVAYAFGYRDWGKPMSLSEVYRNLKPRYRWEWRR